MTPLVGNEYYDILFNLENDFKTNRIKYVTKLENDTCLTDERIEFFDWIDLYELNYYKECEIYFNSLKEKNILENNIEQKETKKGKFKI